MKKLALAILVLLNCNVFSQDINIALKEALNLERSLKDDQALQKYKSVLSMDPANIQALIRSSEISAAIGARQKDKKAKLEFYEQARTYADKALSLDANNADANYVRAVVAGKFTEIEDDSKKLVAHVKDIKTYGDRALSINAQHGKANYVIGKWNFEMVALSWAKRAAIKVLFGGIPDASIENSFKYMEKCKTLEPYFVLNYLELAKAYKYDNQPAKAIAVLNQLVKLPTRTPDDIGLKAEGKKILSEMQ